tara:strand:- start:5797 stop:6282 length:486 start_codon:yes stop_codon:yes gene_type:complete
MKLDDYGDSFSMALKNYIQKVHNHEISAEQAAKLSKSFSISDAIKLSDAIENEDSRVIRNLLLDKIGMEEGYGMNPSQPTPSTSQANKAMRAQPEPMSAPVKSQRNIQPTGQGARLYKAPNATTQNSLTTQQNAELAANNSAKANSNKRDIEQLKKMAGVK